MAELQVKNAIPSRPIYGRLSPQPGKNHLFVADAEGAEAILDMAKQAPAGFFRSAHIIFIPGRTGQAYAESLEALHPAQFYIGPSVGSAMPRLRQTLATAHMGLRIYLSGTESLIGQAMQATLEAGFDHHSIQTEHRGSLMRRVQCVHCKGITDEVTTQPVRCAHCGLMLLVRDHYSRRLAAFQGVCINAETPHEVPEMEEVFR